MANVLLSSLIEEPIVLHKTLLKDIGLDHLEQKLAENRIVIWRNFFVHYHIDNRREHLLIICVRLVDELVVFKPVLNDLYDLRNFFPLDFCDGAFEEVLDLWHVVVLWLGEPFAS